MADSEPQLTLIKEHSEYCYQCDQPKAELRKTRQRCASTVDGRHQFVRQYLVDLKELFGG